MIRHVFNIKLHRQQGKTVKDHERDLFVVAQTTEGAIILAREFASESYGEPGELKSVWEVVTTFKLMPIVAVGHD